MGVGCATGGFTLIELMVVIVVIGILAAIVLGVANSAQTNAYRNRAAAEIAAVEVALTRFEVDNGFVPAIPFIATNSGTYPGDPRVDAYRQASRALYFALTGRTKFDYDAQNPTNHTVYMEFKELQVGDRGVLGNTSLSQTDSGAYTNNANFTAGSYLVDPWKNAYGFHHNPDADPTALHNRARHDLWSTAGDTNAAPADHIRARWLSNWARK